MPVGGRKYKKVVVKSKVASTKQRPMLKVAGKKQLKKENVK